MSEPVVTVPIKDVLRMIQFHAEGNHEQVKALAVELADELGKNGHDELAMYILAQYSLIPTWRPM